MIRIPIPCRVGPGEHRVLRSFAAWYIRQVHIHGAAYGAKRHDRRRRQQAHRIRAVSLR